MGDQDREIQPVDNNGSECGEKFGITPALLVLKQKAVSS
jgi:hypothetical protein